MIPADDDSLPEGSEEKVVRMVRDMYARAPRQGGVVSLIEDDGNGENIRVVDFRPWEGSPMFVILEYFGLAYTEELYHEVLRSAQEGEQGTLFLLAERHKRGDGPHRAALVQTIVGWTIADAEGFLAQQRQ